MKIRWWILFSVSLGTFVSVVNVNIVNVALPTITRTMHLELAMVQWVVLIFSVTVVSALLIAGHIADLVGRKKIYANGFLILMAGSLVCGLAPNFFFLLLGRLIQGLGAAMPMANGMALITLNFPPGERGQALGIIGSVVGVGALAGPVLGGLLIDALGWHWVFFFNIPLGLLAFATANLLLPQDEIREKQERSFDYTGAVLFAVSVVLLLLGLSGGAGSTAAALLLFACLVVFLGFLRWEKSRQEPLLDITLFKIPLFSTSVAAAFFAYLSMAALMILGPFFLEEVLGCTPSQVGLLMAPYPLLLSLTAPVSGWLSDRWGPYYLTTGGLLINISGLLLLSFLGSDATYADIALCLILLGLGMGMFHSPNNSTLMGAVPFSSLGIAGGINSLVRNLGMIIGTTVAVALFSLIRNNYLAGLEKVTALQEMAAFLQGWRAAFLLAAFAALMAVCFSAARGKLFKSREGENIDIELIADK